MKSLILVIGVGLVAFGASTASAATKLSNGSYAISGTTLCQMLPGASGLNPGEFHQIVGRVSLTATATGATGTLIKTIGFWGPFIDQNGNVAVDTGNSASLVLTVSGSTNPYFAVLKVGTESSSGYLVMSDATAGVARQASLVLRFRESSKSGYDCSMQLNLVHE